jgi:hypothetical protein
MYFLLFLSEEGFVVDACVFEELLGVIIELLLSDLISHFEYLLVEHGFPALGHQSIDEISGGLQ